MALISLNRLLNKPALRSVLQTLIGTIGVPIGIQDRSGKWLLGESLDPPTQRCPIELEQEVLGWVVGDLDATKPLIVLLNYLLNQELEKRLLARETLDKYQEITLLYTISEKIAASLDLEAIATLVLDEAKDLIQSTSGSVIVWNAETAQHEIVAAFGQQYGVKLPLVVGRGIVGSVLASGIGEIVNDVQSDPRFVQSEYAFSSLICVPLKLKDQVFGVINLSHVDPILYTAAELKLITTLATQAAAAIDNALLHASKLKEERIKSNLERYVAPQVVQSILESRGEISLGAVRRNLVILFSDIRNFTTQCEELPPEAIVGYLNEYFTHMVEVIFQHKGTVNKFVGDMIVALFGAPSPLIDSERQAIEAAIAMQRQLQRLPTAWIRDNFHTGIGISSGEVIVGNIGSPQHLDYTAIGDEVNIASRLQSLAQGGQILVTRSVYAAVQDLFTFKAYGSVTVKGKKKSIEVFEVIY